MYVSDPHSQIFVLSLAQLSLGEHTTIVVTGDQLENALFDALDEQRRYGNAAFKRTVGYENALLTLGSDVSMLSETQLLNAVVRDCVCKNLPLPTSYNVFAPTLATAVAGQV